MICTNLLRSHCKSNRGKGKREIYKIDKQIKCMNESIWGVLSPLLRTIFKISFKYKIVSILTTPLTFE